MDVLTMDALRRTYAKWEREDDPVAMLTMTGPGRDGKATIFKVLPELVGENASPVGQRGV